MDAPTLAEIADAFDDPYVSRWSPAMAAAHLLAMGHDGTALCELAALSDSEFDAALELLPAVRLEVADVLDPARLETDHDEEDEEECVAAYFSHADIGDRVDVLAELVERLAEVLESRDIGELDGLSDEGDEHALVAYGADAAALWDVMRPVLAESAVRMTRAELRFAP